MSVARFRLNSYQLFWLSSVLTSFYFGYSDRFCSKTLEQLELDSQPFLPKATTSPITLFAPTLERQNDILEKLFEESEEFSFGSDGFRVASEYFFKKASDWYRSPKEAPRLDQAGCGMEMMRDVIRGSLFGSVPIKSAQQAYGGELYIMPLLREQFRSYTRAKNDVDSPSAVKIGTTGKRSTKQALEKTVEKELLEVAEKAFNMTPTAQIGLIVQNPRQWALEVVNERHTLPTSDHYMDAISEYVLMLENLIPQCTEIAKTYSGKCTLLRLEDIISRPAEVFNLPSLSPVDFELKNRFEIPIVENEVDSKLSRIKKQLSSLGYAGWETKDRLHSLNLVK
ncbi:Oidioi.mRNA.OKI2018_I69.XSR.g15735.t1.cds [Oikopleura dioica]|uniref:Oidioi.mRNA.OKI2018_I69.XSR.g15735.t1.cds n=1 Tax=Oikopleura dioica TaxID=34765 RepID=A0ABN7SIW1_OIKDI|nr:Oidioi.mRNA.OKI2018_I69.XSR.g15735.t1.cds [Oikopleura dioica]